jgi:hypothetical protein
MSIWTRQTRAACPAAVEIAWQVVSLPGESLFNSRFAETRRILSDALQDMSRQNHAIAEDVTDHRIILSVDPAVFCPLITLSEDVEVRCLKHLKQIHDPDLFRHFLEDREAFTDFLQRHWYEAYFNMFAFQIQLIRPAFRCSIVHVYAAPNGKGTQEMVRSFLQLKPILETEFDFVASGLAFDGDSCFNNLHDNFTE